MNATGLPIPTASVPPATPEAPPSPVSTNGQAPTDFMIALAQMLGTAVPATTVEAQVATQTQAEADLDATDDAAALALLSLPVAPLQPQIALPQQNAQVETDPLELLGLGAKPAGPSARDAALMQALTERLAATEETPAPADSVNVTNPTYQPTIDTQQPVRATSDGAITRPVHVPVGSQGWAEEVGARLTLMTQKGEHTASLRLSPEHLGPLEVRISMRDDQASVWFGAAHADTRAAIEHALPKLRDMFTAQGMSLTDAGVFREPPRQQMPTFTESNSNSNEPAAAEVVSAPVQVKVGLFDAYA
jgi:flagellar hook-length control protein FliK